MRTIRVCAVGVLALAGVACGGDDDDGAAEPAAAETDAGADGDGGDASGGAGGDSDDIIDAILRNVFGLTADVLDDGERDCMNEQLAPAFPDGVADDIELTEELVDIIDAAAETCGAEIGL